MIKHFCDQCKKEIKEDKLEIFVDIFAQPPAKRLWQGQLCSAKCLEKWILTIPLPGFPYNESNGKETP